MQLVSFNPFRSLGIPGTVYVKPEEIFRCKERIRGADWILFPEFWQVNALVYGLKKRIFPSISTYHLGHDKVEMTRVFWTVCPQNVPRTRIYARDESNIQKVMDEFDFPFVAKEVRNSIGRGVILIHSRREWFAYARENTVWLVQEYLPIHRDLRVVVIGAKAVAAYWREIPEGGFYSNVARGGRISFTGVPPEAVSMVERISGNLNINHAGFDLAETEDGYYFFEFNPFFGLRGLKERRIIPGEVIYDYLLKLSEPSHDPEKPILSLAG
ncbi:MAG TPA: ATP-grasp domain-containing protein [Desulfobacterales bacterium]|nr:ATP-grasp domain-containing protein [Desulfobacterales bacterium]